MPVFITIHRNPFFMRRAYQSYFQVAYYYDFSILDFCAYFWNKKSDKSQLMNFIGSLTDPAVLNTNSAEQSEYYHK